MAVDGFTSYNSEDHRWLVHCYIPGQGWGSKFVHAPSESIALARFMAKYPNAKVDKLEDHGK